MIHSGPLDVASLWVQLTPQPHFPHLLYFIWHKWDKISFPPKFLFLKRKRLKPLPNFTYVLVSLWRMWRFHLSSAELSVQFSIISRAEFTYGGYFHDGQGNLIQIKSWNRFWAACSASSGRSNCHPSVTLTLTLTRVCGVRSFLLVSLSFSAAGYDFLLSPVPESQKVLFLRDHSCAFQKGTERALSSLNLL